MLLLIEYRIFLSALFRSLVRMRGSIEWLPYWSSLTLRFPLFHLKRPNWLYPTWRWAVRAFTNLIRQVARFIFCLPELKKNCFQIIGIINPCSWVEVAMILIRWECVPLQTQISMFEHCFMLMLLSSKSSKLHFSWTIPYNREK